MRYVSKPDIFLFCPALTQVRPKAVTRPGPTMLQSQPTKRTLEMRCGYLSCIPVAPLFCDRQSVCVFLGPVMHRLKQGYQTLPQRREAILNMRWDGSEIVADNKASLLQFTQLTSQRPVRDATKVPLQLVKAKRSLRQPIDDQQFPSPRDGRYERFYLALLFGWKGIHGSILSDRTCCCDLAKLSKPQITETQWRSRKTSPENRS